MTMFYITKKAYEGRRDFRGDIYPMKNSWKQYTDIITENLPGRKSVKKIPGIGGLIGQVCSVTKFLFVYNDKPVPTNQATYCLWYVAVERIKKRST